MKKQGLYVWIGIATIIANIEVTKCIDIFGMSLTLGNVIYGTIFLATDILSEIYGDKDSRKGVYIGFLSMITFTLLTQINLLYIPNKEDFVSSSMQIIFQLTPRICIGSLIAYIISNILDTYIYKFIKIKLPSDKWLWLRNNGSTMISQIIDSIIFTIISFIGIFDIKIIIELIITTYILKVIIAVCDTPFIYLSKK